MSVDGCRMIDLQEDLASIFHRRPALAPHLSAIIRSVVPTQADQSIAPAINL
jgi:hypothetical protein